MKWVKRIGLLFASLVALCWVVGHIIMHTVCKDEVMQRVLSPSGRYAAEVEESYCTVGSDWDTWVTIRRRPFFFSFQRLGSASTVLYIYGPASRLRLNWRSNSELVVECLGCKQTDVRATENRWKGISVRFSIVPPGADAQPRQ